MARLEEFDRSKVLHDATLIFWHQGYQATGIKDLELATGLSRSSLYNSFGSKELLFLEVLNFYVKDILAERFEKCLLLQDPILAVEKIFISFFRDPARGRKGMACLIVNTTTEMAIHNKIIHKAIKKTEAWLLENFIFLIDKARQAGIVFKIKDNNVIARHLLIVLNGLLVQSKITQDNEEMTLACEQTLSLFWKELS